jgi:uncharacterized protein YhaN
MENADETTIESNTTWAPLDDAMAQMKEFDEKAREMVRTTADEVRNRSEKALDDAREQTEKTLKLVRKNLDEARESIEERASVWPDFLAVPTYVEKQVETLQSEFLKAVASVAKSLRLSTRHDLDALKRKVSQLEKKVAALSEDKAA